MDFVMLRERSKSPTSLSRHFSPLLWGKPPWGWAREFRKEEEEAPPPTRWGKTSVVRPSFIRLNWYVQRYTLSVSREFPWNVVKPFLLEICYFSLSLDRGVSCRGWVSSFSFSTLPQFFWQFEGLRPLYLFGEENLSTSSIYNMILFKSFNERLWLFLPDLVPSFPLVWLIDPPPSVRTAPASRTGDVRNFPYFFSSMWRERRK